MLPSRDHEVLCVKNEKQYLMSDVQINCFSLKYKSSAALLDLELRLLRDF